MQGNTQEKRTRLQGRNKLRGPRESRGDILIVCVCVCEMARGGVAGAEVKV